MDYLYIVRMQQFIHKIKSFLLPKNSTKMKNMLGRWNLKEKKLCEDITVFNANRDHCGDYICGKAEEYVKLAPKSPK